MGNTALKAGAGNVWQRVSSYCKSDPEHVDDSNGGHRREHVDTKACAQEQNNNSVDRRERLQPNRQTANKKRPLAVVHAPSTGPGRQRCNVANFVGDGARSLSYPGPRPGAIQITQNDRTQPIVHGPASPVTVPPETFKTILSQGTFIDFDDNPSNNDKYF
jgi:hypothetical protein